MNQWWNFTQSLLIYYYFIIISAENNIRNHTNLWSKRNKSKESFICQKNLYYYL